jgi:BirA family transcriptional regulator, biotin operon repressor / biotin---[acetyl-CoA-carboxylase] ligase
LSSNRSDHDERSAALPEDFADALAAVRPRLGRLGSSIVYFPSIGSTNDVAATLAIHNACEGAIVIADTQTAGRGRRGREWFSPPGSGLYVSIVLTPGRSRHGGDRSTRLLTLTAGIALVEAVAIATGLPVDVKWPNDLYIARRKLAGILAEAVGGGAEEPIVLGYGINVGAAAYPTELRDRATSLESELGRQVDRALLLAESLASLARRYDDLLAGRFDAILDAWRARAPTAIGARVTWATAAGAASGVTAGIDDEGALLVRVGERVERIVAGEISWL